MSDAVIVGGANMDLHARSLAPVIVGTSNPGVADLTPGGVGRNVAENLARLGTSTAFISAVGDDPLGDDVLAHTAEAGVEVSLVRRRSGRTGTYNAILDADGEMVVAIADMAAVDAVTPLVIEAARGAIARARVLVLDGNIPAATIGAALDIATEAGVPVAFDPVSVPKASRVVDEITPKRRVFMVTPNRAELAALSGTSTDTDDDLVLAAQQVHKRGVRVVWVRLGARGSLLSDGDRVTWLPATRAPGEIVDVTGAGDATLAAFCHAWLGGAEPLDAARFGHAAAALTCRSPDTVRSDMSDDLVRSLL